MFYFSTVNKSEAAGEFFSWIKSRIKTHKMKVALWLLRAKKVINSTLFYASAKWAKLQAAEIKYIFSKRGVAVWVVFW